ncbi:MAG: hypothetical protein KAI47_23840, partial [Deltaproteobacteria bacterium]|nr:hypothetical protein [Deltaproteobacteria bacterium]
MVRAILTVSLVTLGALNALSGCVLGPIDTMGVEAVVTESEEKTSEATLKDDKIEDKKPTS